MDSAFLFQESSSPSTSGESSSVASCSTNLITYHPTQHAHPHHQLYQQFQHHPLYASVAAVHPGGSSFHNLPPPPPPPSLSAQVAVVDPLCQPPQTNSFHSHISSSSRSPPSTASAKLAVNALATSSPTPTLSSYPQMDTMCTSTGVAAAGYFNGVFNAPLMPPSTSDHEINMYNSMLFGRLASNVSYVSRFTSLLLFYIYSCEFLYRCCMQIIYSRASSTIMRRGRVSIAAIARRSPTLSCKRSREPSANINIRTL